MSRLEELVAGVRDTVERRRSEIALDELREQLGTRTGYRPFSEALVGPGLSLIAEFKRRSPSAGEIRGGADLSGIVAAYERGGAAALSILTEEHQFGGSLGDLQAARDGCDLPILRKDFTVDPYQLYEAAASGADAVLLVVAALADADLAGLYDEARALDLDDRVEVERPRLIVQPAEVLRLQGSDDEEDRVRAVNRGLDELVGIDHEVLAKQGQIRGRARGPEVVQGAAEPAVLGEDRERGGAATLVRADHLLDGDAGADLPGARRAPLELGDQRQAGANERLLERSRARALAGLDP